MKNLLKILLISILVFALASCGESEAPKDTEVKTVKKETREEKEKKKRTEKVVFSEGKQDIIKLQLEKGPDIVNTLDCDKYSEDGKEYCLDEKEKLKEIKEEITWESVLKKGNKYIVTFDCNKIESDYGKKYCTDYKKTITPAK